MTPLEKDKKILDVYIRQFEIIGKVLEDARLRGLKKVTIPKAHCTKCGDVIIGDEDSLCGKCAG